MADEPDAMTDDSFDPEAIAAQLNLDATPAMPNAWTGDPLNAESIDNINSMGPDAWQQGSAPEGMDQGSSGWWNEVNGANADMTPAEPNALTGAPMSAESINAIRDMGPSAWQQGSAPEGLGPGSAGWWNEVNGANGGPPPSSDNAAPEGVGADAAPDPALPPTPAPTPAPQPSLGSLSAPGSLAQAPDPLSSLSSQQLTNALSGYTQGQNSMSSGNVDAIYRALLRGQGGLASKVPPGNFSGDFNMF